MLCTKRTTRLYKDQINANHAVGALQRYGWEVKDAPARIELAKGKVAWEVTGVKPVSLLVKLYDAYMAARKIIVKALAS